MAEDDPTAIPGPPPPPWDQPPAPPPPSGQAPGGWAPPPGAWQPPPPPPPGSGAPWAPPPPGYGAGGYGPGAGGYPPPPPGSGYYGYAPAQPRAEGMAVWSLVLGILSLLCLGLLAGVPAIILSVSAKRRIRSSAEPLGGGGLATAGLVTGIIGTAWSALVLLIVVPLAIFGSSTSSSTDFTNAVTVLIAAVA